MRSERSSVLVIVIIAALFVGVFALIGRSVLGDASAPVAAHAFDPATVKPGLVSTPGLPERIDPATAWTGDRLFVYGGYRPGTGKVVLLTDAALVEPGTGAVEELPASPLGVLDGARAIRVDDTIVVIGPSCTEIIQPEEGESEGCRPGTYRAAVFDLTKRTWREVKVPSGLSKFGAFTSGEGRITNALGATSGGRAVFEVGPPVFLGGNMEYWSYSPSRDEWADLGSPGIRPEAACVAGDQLVVATAKYLNNGVVKDDSPFRHLTPGGSASGGPGDGWVEPSIASLSVDHPGFWTESAPASDVMIKLGDPKLSCMGDSALVFGGDRTNVRRFDLTSGAWSTPALPPAGPIPFNTDARLWTGTELLLRSETATLPGGSSAYDPATNSWRAVTGVPPGLSNASWSGSAVVGYSEPLDGAKAGIYWYPVG